DNFSIREISDAVNIGDDLAIVNFMEMGKILGIGLSSVANLTGIPIFVIGGGISQVNNLLFETAQQTMVERVIPELKDLVEIRKSNLYNLSGIYGAALYAKENKK
ncbi:ROK family protein, partial [bacterium]